MARETLDVLGRFVFKGDKKVGVCRGYGLNQATGNFHLLVEVDTGGAHSTQPGTLVPVIITASCDVYIAPGAVSSQAVMGKRR